MRQPYWDLYKLAKGKRPLWFDEQGVPRWIPFRPDEVNDAYAETVALYEIECQSCHQRFAVAESWSRWKFSDAKLEEWPALAERLRGLNWGDPPCWMARDGKLVQCSGSVSSSINIRLLEVWQRTPPELWKSIKCDWTRLTELEMLDIVGD
jgi:hypothetical protein